MTRYILNCLTRQKWVVFIWGFHHPTSISNGLRFSANCFIHKGLVEVVYNEGTDLFDITLLIYSATKSLTTNVPVSELIEVLDCLIEKVENYDERVKDEYSLL